MSLPPAKGTVTLSPSPLVAAWQTLAVLGKPTPRGSKALLHQLHSVGTSLARQQGGQLRADHRPRKLLPPLSRLDSHVIPRRLIAGRWLIRRMMRAAFDEGRGRPPAAVEASTAARIRERLDEGDYLDRYLHQDIRKTWSDSLPVVFLAAGIIQHFEFDRDEHADAWLLFSNPHWVGPAIECADKLVEIARNLDNRPADPSKRIAFILRTMPSRSHRARQG